MILLLTLAMTLSSFADSLHAAYASQDAQAVRDLLTQADTPTERWMATYRLYPLTEDASVLEGLPDDPPDDASARQLALLSGLWAYRAGEASFLSAMQKGRRSMRFLETAMEKNPDDPYVLLVQGQSLLFRPAIAGKDVDEAAQVFDRLRAVVAATDDVGISKTEAAMWHWLALRECGRTHEAQSLHNTLLADDPAPLFKQFLHDPPQV